MRKNEKPAHRDRTIERHLNYQIGVESVFGTNTKFKGMSRQFVRIICLEYGEGLEREEVRLRILRHPFAHLEKSVLALPPTIAGQLFV
jgi:hypothetical protein